MQIYTTKKRGIKNTPSFCGAYTTQKRITSYHHQDLQAHQAPGVHLSH